MIKLKTIALAVSLLSINTIVFADDFEVYQGSAPTVEKQHKAKKKVKHSSESVSESKASPEIEIVMTKAPDFQKVDNKKENDRSIKIDSSDKGIQITQESNLDEDLARARHSKKKAKVYKESVKKEKAEDSSMLTLSDKNAATVEAPKKNEFVVSNDVYAMNEINVPFNVVKLLYPTPVPIEQSKISYENDNKKVIFSFKSEGFNRKFPVKIIGEKESLSVVFNPKPIQEGAIVNLSTEKNSVSNLVRKTPTMMPRETPTEQDIQLMNKLMDNALSDDFTDVTPPKVTRFDTFVAVPLMKKTNGSRNVLTFQLIATNNNVTNVTPKLFGKPGVLAVSLSKQQVEPGKITHLYIIEEADGNE